MSSGQKVWVIPTAASPSRPPSGRGGEGGRPLRPGEVQSPRRSGERRPRHPLLRFVLAYASGPLAPLTLGGGRNRFPAVVALLWALVGAAALGQGGALWEAVRTGSLPLLPVAAATLGWILVGGLAWGWGVAHAGRHLRGGAPLPVWIQSAPAVGAIGCVAPGAGLSLAGHPWRGGAVVAFLGPLAAALLALGLAPVLWDASEAGSGAIDSALLEWMLLGAVAVVGVGLLLWLVQALDGLRLALPRLRVRSSRADLLAALLLVALAAAPWFLRPSRLAGPAEGWADRLEGEGLEIAPLLLLRGAAWIDPGNPLHALHAARLHEALGQDREARRLREDLRRRWEAIAPSLAPPSATTPATEDLLPGPVPPALPDAGSASF